MKPSEYLRKGLAKLGPNGEHWIQGDFAQDASGNLVFSGSRTAHCFCSMGAVQAVNPNCIHEERFLRIAVGGGSVTDYNDTPETTFEDVKAKFLEAIALAEKEEALSEAQ